ncbi:hypothetical protein TSUD_277640 [Trifolium subterraneum]|uniref:Uncharacterized protein n=1 Tax=Trifolium subterraneum TaxID=3900 RepID=A0A2Z6MVH5_TRISU|nr:hypothetical protein TSUD_277640 [Trifolium subterraneum]
MHCWFELLSLLNELLCFTVAVTLYRYNFDYLCPSASVQNLASQPQVFGLSPSFRLKL